MKNNVTTAEILGKNHPGADKVAHYNWNIRNAPGEFLMIPKQELEVDQRLRHCQIPQQTADASALQNPTELTGKLPVATYKKLIHRAGVTKAYSHKNRI